MSSPTTTPTLQVCRNCGGGAPVDVHFCPAVHPDSDARPPRRLFRVSGRAAQAQSRRRRSRAAVSRAEPAVSSRLLLQRDAGRASREPRAVVVSERRVPHAAQADRARRVPARARRVFAKGTGLGDPEAMPAAAMPQGAGGAARRSVCAQRGARRGARPAQQRRGGRRVGARLERARAPIEAKRAAHEAELQDLSARWDALGRRDERGAGADPSARRS